MAGLAWPNWYETNATSSRFADSAATQKLIVTPQNLPASILLKNAVCNGTNTAAVTLVNMVTAANVTTGTAFTYFLVP